MNEYRSQKDHRSQKLYWENAGRTGYINTYYTATSVGDRITGRTWSAALEMAAEIGIPQPGRILDLGCGDGTFSNRLLAQKYESILGVDFSEAGIARASTQAASPSVTFKVMDLVVDDLRTLGQFDGVFCMGILHHVKKQAPQILKVLRTMTGHIIVLEPNGAHIVRKALELTPAYIAAGEDSFRHSQLVDMFRAARFKVVIHRRLNIFPNNAPDWAFRVMKPIEPVIENTPILRGLCTVNAYACIGE